LTAIALVGGGASIPTVTTTLSEQLGAPIITAPRPQLTAATGAALRAARGPADSQTALAPTAAGTVADATTKSEIPVEPRPAPALAWSEEADDDSGIEPIRPGEYPEQSSTAGLAAPRPQASLDRDSHLVATRQVAVAWYRRPVVVMVATALAVLAVGAAIMITLRHTSGNAPTTPSPGVSTAPGTDSQAPATSPPSSTESDTGTPPSTTSEAPTTTTTTTTAAPTTTSSAAPTTTEPPTTTQGTERPGFPRSPGGPRGFPDPGRGER
jgi:hypothetical protein